MSARIRISATILVPASALRVKAVRSGGPGGQNVNKVSSKVELRVDPTRIEGLDEASRERLRHLIRNRMDADGLWIVVSERSRDQLTNLEDARSKVAQTIAEAMRAPIPRHATRPTKSSRERRVTAKKRAGAIKRSRSGDWD